MLLLLGNNAIPRPNMDAAIGAEFNMTADHVTEGSITVKMPSTETPPQECDRFYITELDPDYLEIYYTVTEGDLSGTWEQLAGKLLNGALGLHSWNSYFYKYQVILGANGYDVTKNIVTTIIPGEKIYMPRVIFSGTIMEVAQQDTGNDATLSYKLYDLTLASAARCLTRVYCDIKIPTGASVTQILYGNYADYPWYSSSLATFPGLFKTRILPEGFDSRTFNDLYGLLPERFDTITLNSAANLWGLTVAEVLDTLAANTGAYWAIDEWDTFSFIMARNADAPFALNSSAPVFDFKPTRDSFTTYSAVRLIGGSGPAAPTSAIAVSTARDDYKTNTLEIIDSTHGSLQFPLDKYYQFRDNPSAPYNGHCCMYFSDYPGAPTATYYPVYYDGIETVPAGVQAATVTHGSQGITLVNGLTWPALPSTPTSSTPVVYFRYAPIVPIVARLTDPTLQAEVKEQAGGSGTIEYIYSDDSIKDFAQAATTAANLLTSVSKRTVSVDFSTYSAGFRTGQTLGGDLPYYGISENYLVTAVKTVLERADDAGEAVWRYDVSASTAAYRDALKGLFYTPTVSSFKLGQDFPAADGVFVQSGVGFVGACWVYSCDPWTWTELDAEGRSWDDIAALGYTWDDWLNRASTHSYGTYDGLTSRVTDDGAAVLLSILNGELIPTSGQYDLTHHIRIETEDASYTETFDLPSKDPAIYGSSDRVVSQYVFTPASGYRFTKCYVRSNTGVDFAVFPIDLDTRAGGPFNGHSACIYTMWEPYSTTTGIGGYITQLMKDALAVAIRNPVFGVRNSLYTSRFITEYLASYASEGLTNYESRIYNIRWVFLIHNLGDTHTSWIYPSGDSVKQDRSLLTVYYVPPEERYIFNYAYVGNPGLQGPIPFVFDKSAESPLGDYTLTIVKKDVVI